jgi:hypothetical protein
VIGVDYGDPRLPDRLWVKIIPEPNTGCWFWVGYTDRKGYGITSFRGRQIRVHRLLWIELVGLPPEFPLQPDHLCTQESCARPDHLEWVTPRVNILRGDTIAARNAAKTRCKRDHPLTGPGADVYMTSTGSRRCRPCQRTAHRNRTKIEREYPKEK